jgi:hypothetical protein
MILRSIESFVQRPKADRLLDRPGARRVNDLLERCQEQLERRHAREP